MCRRTPGFTPVSRGDRKTWLNEFPVNLKDDIKVVSGRSYGHKRTSKKETRINDNDFSTIRPLRLK